MTQAIRFSQKLSGALTIDITSLPSGSSVVVEQGAITVPAIGQGRGSYIVDDAYLLAVQQFIASIKLRRPPVYVRFEEDGRMVEAPKDARGEPDEEPGGPKP